MQWRDEVNFSLQSYSCVHISVLLFAIEPQPKSSNPGTPGNLTSWTSLTATNTAAVTVHPCRRPPKGKPGTGCLTCKKCRVKRGEELLSCRNCTSFGRQFEGYEPFSASSPSILDKTTERETHSTAFVTNLSWSKEAMDLNEHSEAQYYQLANQSRP